MCPFFPYDYDCYSLWDGVKSFIFAWIPLEIGHNTYNILLYSYLLLQYFFLFFNHFNFLFLWFLSKFWKFLVTDKSLFESQIFTLQFWYFIWWYKTCFYPRNHFDFCKILKTEFCGIFLEIIITIFLPFYMLSHLKC